MNTQPQSDPDAEYQQALHTLMNRMGDGDIPLSALGVTEIPGGDELSGETALLKMKADEQPVRSVKGVRGMIRDALMYVLRHVDPDTAETIDIHESARFRLATIVAEKIDVEPDELYPLFDSLEAGDILNQKFSNILQTLEESDGLLSRISAEQAGMSLQAWRHELFKDAVTELREQLFNNGNLAALSRADENLPEFDEYPGTFPLSIQTLKTQHPEIPEVEITWEILLLVGGMRVTSGLERDLTEMKESVGSLPATLVVVGGIYEWCRLTFDAASELTGGQKMDLIISDSPPYSIGNHIDLKTANGDIFIPVVPPYSSVQTSGIIHTDAIGPHVTLASFSELRNLKPQMVSEIVGMSPDEVGSRTAVTPEITFKDAAWRPARFCIQTRPEIVENRLPALREEDSESWGRTVLEQRLSQGRHSGRTPGW